jgi:hypothetical protein
VLLPAVLADASLQELDARGWGSAREADELVRRRRA